MVIIIIFFWGGFFFLREFQLIASVPNDTFYHYHQIKTPIDFWYRRRLNTRSLLSTNLIFNQVALTNLSDKTQWKHPVIEQVNCVKKKKKIHIKQIYWSYPLIIMNKTTLMESMWHHMRRNQEFGLGDKMWIKVTKFWP